MRVRRKNVRVVPGRNGAAAFKKWVNPHEVTSAARPLTDEQRSFAERYLHLCRARAREFSKRLPFAVDIWDLHQAAYVGLSDAVRTFDPSLGVKFETHAHRRMVGAIQDMLRGEGLIRLKKRRGNPELKFVSIDMPIAEAGLGGYGFVTYGDYVLPPSPAPDPDASLESEEGFEVWLRHMDPDDRFIVESYYGHEALSMREIGARLGISQSRVSQRHDAILARLRAKATSPRFCELLSA